MRPNDQDWCALLTIHLKEPYGRFCQKRTSAIADLNGRLWSRAASLLPGWGMAAFPKRWPEPADLLTVQLLPFWHGERTADSDEVTSSTGAIQLEATVAKPESGRSVRISGLANGKSMVAMSLSGSR